MLGAFILWFIFCFVCLCVFRYASLYFCCAIEEQDNELITLEVIHRFVELLDKYFGSVSDQSLNFCKTVKKLNLHSK